MVAHFGPPRRNRRMRGRGWGIIDGMSRRLIASLSGLLVALLAVAAVALAAGGESSSPTTAAAPAAAAAPSGSVAPATTPTATAKPFRRGHGRFAGRGRAHGGPMFGMLRKLLLKSGADRLGVTPEKLKDAVKAVADAQLARQAAAAKLTAAETAALKGCHAAKGTCDRAALRSAIKKLRALPKPDLAALKTELSDALAAQLGLTGAKVLEAARAELSDRLDQAVKIGFLTADGRTKALACFDAPASCDLKALRGTLKLGRHGFGGRHGGHGMWQRRHFAYPSAPAAKRRGGKHA